MSDDVNEPKTVHVWIHDGRSLCDRRAIPAEPTNLEEFDASEALTASAPACGSCLLLVESLRQAAALALRTGNGIWPALPKDAWLALKGTRWEADTDLSGAAFTDSELDRSAFSWILEAMPEQLVAELARRAEAKSVEERRRFASATGS